MRLETIQEQDRIRTCGTHINTHTNRQIPTMSAHPRYHAAYGRQATNYEFRFVNNLQELVCRRYQAQWSSQLRKLRTACLKLRHAARDYVVVVRLQHARARVAEVLQNIKICLRRNVCLHLWTATHRLKRTIIQWIFFMLLVILIDSKVVLEGNTFKK